MAWEVTRYFSHHLLINPINIKNQSVKSNQLCCNKLQFITNKNNSNALYVCVSIHVGAYGSHIHPQLIKPFLLSISVLMAMGLNHGYKIIKLF